MIYPDVNFNFYYYFNFILLLLISIFGIGYWKWMEREGVNLEPVLRASEKFLRVWEYVIAHKGEF